MEKQKVIISKKLWSRGGPGYASRLLMPDGTKCCLGFVCEQVFGSKLENESLGVFSSQTFYPRDRDLTADWSWYEARMHDAAEINDNVSSDDDERIARLQKLFSDSPIELEFVE